MQLFVVECKFDILLSITVTSSIAKRRVTLAQKSVYYTGYCSWSSSWGFLYFYFCRERQTRHSRNADARQSYFPRRDYIASGWYAWRIPSLPCFHRHHRHQTRWASGHKYTVAGCSSWASVVYSKGDIWIPRTQAILSLPTSHKERHFPLPHAPRQQHDYYYYYTE